MKKTKLSLIFASIAFWLVSAGSASWCAEFKSPLIPVTKDFKLPNGLRVILSEDHSVPVSAVAIVYDVGARNEKKGRSGFAHLFEHMMFKGSMNVGDGEHSSLIANNGGGLNGTTNTDRTLYFETLPKNQLDLGPVG